MNISSIDQNNLPNQIPQSGVATDIFGGESKPEASEEVPAMAASVEQNDDDQKLSDINSYAVLDSKIRKYYGNQTFLELIELFQENFTLNQETDLKVNCKRCVVHRKPHVSFEYAAFTRAVQCLLRGNKYTVDILRAQARRKQTKFNRLVTAYIEEIEGYVNMKIRVNATERYHMQFGLPSAFTIKHEVDLAGYEPFVDMIMHKLDIFSKVTNLKSHLMSAVLCMLNIWRNIDRPSTCILSISQFIMNLQLGDDTVRKATDFFTNIYNKISEFIAKQKSDIVERFTAQASFTEIADGAADFTSMIPLLGGSISVLLSLLFLRVMPGSNSFDTIFNRFSRLSGVIKSVKDVSALGSGIITEAIDAFCISVFGVERPVMDEWKNVNGWMDEVQSVMKPGFESDLKNNEQLKNTVESLLQRGMSILRTLDMLKVPYSERSAINQCIMFLMRARETAGNCGAGQTKPRVAPSITHMFGASGVGKSTILWALIAEIQAALGATSPLDLHEKTFFRRPGAKFWDGYSSGINVVVCDDFGAKKDNEANPNEEFIEAIHMSNTAFWQLNMADLQDKRSTYFQAKSVIWTSNRSKFDMTSLTNAEAVIQRVDLKIRQKPHPDYMKYATQSGKTVEILDKMKVNAAIKQRLDAGESLPHNPMLDCVLFDVIDKDSPNDDVLESDLTFWQIAKRIVTTTVDNMKYFEAFNQTLNEHMIDAIARCKSGSWKAPERFAVQCSSTPEELRDTLLYQVRELKKQFGYIDSNIGCLENAIGVGSMATMREQLKMLQIFRARLAMKVNELNTHNAFKCSHDDSKFDDKLPRYSMQCNGFNSPNKKSWEFYMNPLFENKHRTMSNYLTGSVHFSPWDFYQDFLNCKEPKSMFGSDMKTIMSDDEFKKQKAYFAMAKCGPVTDEEFGFCRRIVKSACFCMDPTKAKKVTRAWWRAKTAFEMKLPGEMTDDVFINLYIQSCKVLYGEILVVSESELCFFNYDKEERIQGLHYKVAGTIDTIHKYVKAHYGMEPRHFWMIAGATAFAFTMVANNVAHKIYDYLFPTVKPKNMGKARARAEGLYIADQAKALKHAQIEKYDMDKTKALQRFMTEGYDTDKTKAFKRAKVEGCHPGNRVDECYKAPCSMCEERGSTEGIKDYIPSGSTAPSGHRNLKGQTYEELSLAEKALWNVMHADVRPLQKKMAAIGKTFGIQACTDQNAAEIVSVAYRNLYKLERFVNGKWTHVVNTLIIKGRLALMNRHITDLVLNNDKWRIRNRYFDGIEFNLKECNVAYIDDPLSPYFRRDIMLVELPRVVHQHKDITSKFMTSDDFSRFKSLKQISAIGYVPSDEHIGIRQYFGNDVMAVDSDFILDNAPLNTIEMKVRKAFKYNIQTTPGDCGAVLVAFDSNFNNKIFGIHSAGTEAPRFTGLGTPVTRGTLQALEDKLQLEFSEANMYPNFECADNIELDVQQLSETETLWHLKRKIEGNFYELGQAPERVHGFSKTQIHPSPVYGVIQEPTMAPAVLHKVTKVIDGEKVVFDPMAMARAKASPISKPIDERLLDRCARDYYQKINMNTLESDRVVLSFEEAIAGKEGDICYSPMKRSTSPGYGWSKKGKGKTEYLGDIDYIFDHEIVRGRYEKILADCKLGIRPNTIWIDTLKDERRLKAKIDACKTRLFSCGEMVFTIIFRQYFGGFIAHMMRNKISVESCVGVNCYGMDWTEIVSNLSEVGNKILAGDFENYDGTLHPSLLWRILDVINKWYEGTPEETKVRVAIWCEVVNSLHIFGDEVYMWGHSQPSGCPITTILNCGYHSLSARYVYMAIARRVSPENYNFGSFRRYVRHLNYGDDDLWCISDKIVAWFNQVTITEGYKELGMKYTDEAKTGDIVPYRTLFEVNFLKRTFRWDENQARYRAPLAMETIKEMAMWNHGTIDSYELTASILEDAVRELAQHDKKTFETELPIFEKAARIIGERYPVYFETYEGYQEIEGINCGLYADWDN